MAKADAGYGVRRIAAKLSNILLQQNAQLIEAIARTDEPVAVRALSSAIAHNADARAVLALVHANEVPEAELLIETMHLIQAQNRAKKTGKR